MFYIQVLAEEAHPLENLDRGAAQESLSKAQSELNSAANDKVRVFDYNFENFCPYYSLAITFLNFRLLSKSALS